MKRAFLSGLYARGFSLLELILVIVLAGILGAVFGTFTSPLKAAFDASMRARLSDDADGAYRRLARDVRRAVPNTVRTTTAGGNRLLEFIASKEGGRYRDDGVNYSLRFDSSGDAVTDNTFDVLDPGGTVAGNIAAGDLIVVNNLGFGVTDAYSGSNVATVAGVDTANSRVVLAANPYLALGRVADSAGDRFQVVDQNERAVTYSCPDESGAPGNLLRCANYGIAAAQPAACAGGHVLAAHVRCSALDYTPGVYQRTGLVYVQLSAFDPRCAASVSGAATNGCESVDVVYQIHVDNSP